jgi:hypothetical protein
MSDQNKSPPSNPDGLWEQSKIVLGVVGEATIAAVLLYGAMEYGFRKLSPDAYNFFRDQPSAPATMQPLRPQPSPCAPH